MASWFLRTLGWCLVLLLAACSAMDSQPAEVAVRVERMPSQKAFRVTWTLREPVQALAFGRGAGMRQGRWVPLGRGFRFEQRNGRDVLVSQSLTSNFQVMIPERFTEIAGDYPFLSPFSDGGVVVYTGYLDVAPFRCQGSSCLGSEVDKSARRFSSPQLEAVAAPGEILVSGARVSGRSLIVKPPAEGALVYFGRQLVYQQDGYSLVADANLPTWMIREVQSLLPGILSLNAARLGHALKAPPMIYITYSKSSSVVSLSHSGAVVGNQMLLSLYGSRWARRTVSSREEFTKLLAHEAFHLWNASLFHSVNRPGGGWLHEGSADAFAFFSLYEMGVISHSRYSQLVTESLNRCLIGLNGTDLPSSSGALGARNHYHCGAVMEAVLHHDLQTRGLDLWQLWARLFERAAGKGGFYDHEDFFAVANEIAGASGVVSELSRLANGRIDFRRDASRSLESFFFQLFGTAGITLVASEIQWPDWYARAAGERALGEAISADCAGDGYFLTITNGVRLVGGPRCRHLKNDHEIGRIADHRIWRDGVQLYDFIRRNCQERNTIPLTTVMTGGHSSPQSLSLTCPALPQRTRFMRIDQLPRP
jgi:hypothetical protein